MGKKTVPIFLILLFIASCASNISTPIAKTQPKDTPSTSLTAESTSTSTFELILSPAKTHYDLPTWLGNSQDTIFATVTQAKGDSFILTFFNASTGQDFNFHLEDVHSYFWMPGGEHFGFLLKDHQTVQVINMSTGDVSVLYESDWAVTSAINQLSDEVPFPYTVIETPLASERYFLNHPYFVSAYSYDQQFRVYSGLSQAEAGDSPYEIQEVASEKHILLGEADDGWESRWSDWAPIEPRIALLEFDEPFSTGNAITLGKRILIYEVPSGKLWSSHSGLFGQPRWSPDGEQILYVDIQTPEDGYYDYASTPCILDVDDGDKICLEEISNSHPDTSSITHFQWYGASENLSYIISEFSEAPALFRSEFCIFNIIDKIEKCPSNKYPELSELHFTSYQISPNGDFAILAIGESHFDEWSSSTSVLIGLNDEIYKIIGLENTISTYVQFPYGSILWRP